MIVRREIRAVLASVSFGVLLAQPAWAFVTLNDGRDRIYLTAALSVTRDSNIFANSAEQGDFVYSTSLTAEYTRRAGWIGVNANAAISSSRFADFGEQDFNNPSLSLELTKQTGRTTGSITMAAVRESRADAEVNTRSTSWHVPIGLNFKYPIVSTYTLAGSLGYSSRDYVNEFVFASLDTYSASLDLLHMLTKDRDMILGYRYRHSDTSRDTASTDHALSLGVMGRIIRGVMGNVRVGYQTRTPEGLFGQEPTFDSWTASSSLSYSPHKRLAITTTIAKDFATTATDAYVDTTTVTADSTYTHSARWSASTSVSFGDTQFLGEGGRVVIAAGPPPVLGRQRHDNYVTWNAGLNYSRNERFKCSLGYTWFHNWSTVDFADFIRSSWTFTFSSRW